MSRRRVIMIAVGICVALCLLLYGAVRGGSSPCEPFLSIAELDLALPHLAALRNPIRTLSGVPVPVIEGITNFALRLPPPPKELFTPKSLPPGLYKAVPYSMIVINPGPVGDDGIFLTRRGFPDNMPVITPEVRLVPLEKPYVPLK